MKVKNGEYIGVNEEYIPEDKKYVEKSILEKEEKQKVAAARIFKGTWIFFGIFMAVTLLMIIAIFVGMITMMSGSL